MNRYTGAFIQKLALAVGNNNSLLCVGLDNPAKFSFQKKVIDATHSYVCAFKPNSAFYEQYGALGISELKKICSYIQTNYPTIPIILDAKRGDIESTNEAYAKYAFDYLGVDAITLHPYLGKESLMPFLSRRDKGCIILCKTSNPGAGEIQDLILGKDTLSMHIAQQVLQTWNTNKNCLFVMGATYPNDLASIRAFSDEVVFLVPGVGAQGGDLQKALQAGLNKKKAGMIISVSRALVEGSTDKKSFTTRARKLRDQINMYRYS